MDNCSSDSSATCLHACSVPSAQCRLQSILHCMPTVQHDIVFLAMMHAFWCTTPCLPLPR